MSDIRQIKIMNAKNKQKIDVTRAHVADVVISAMSGRQSAVCGRRINIIVSAKVEIRCVCWWVKDRGTQMARLSSSCMMHPRFSIDRSRPYWCRTISAQSKPETKREQNLFIFRLRATIAATRLNVVNKCHVIPICQATYTHMRPHACVGISHLFILRGRTWIQCDE